MSPNSDLGHILLSITVHETPTPKNVSTVGNVSASSVRFWESVLNAENHSIANHYFQTVEIQRVKTGLPPQAPNYSVATAVKEVIADEIKLLDEKERAEIPDIEENVVEHLFGTASPSAQGKSVPGYLMLCNTSSLKRSAWTCFVRLLTSTWRNTSKPSTLPKCLIRRGSAMTSSSPQLHRVSEGSV